VLRPHLAECTVSLHAGGSLGIADRVHIMVDISDDTKIVRCWAEVTGVVRRRRWSDEEKGRIVAEAIGPGAVIADVARRHDPFRSSLELDQGCQRGSLRDTGRRTARVCAGSEIGTTDLPALKVHQFATETSQIRSRSTGRDHTVLRAAWLSLSTHAARRSRALHSFVDHCKVRHHGQPLDRITRVTTGGRWCLRMINKLLDKADHSMLVARENPRHP
jgi:transposase-like protein